MMVLVVRVLWYSHEVCEAEVVALCIYIICNRAVLFLTAFLIKVHCPHSGALIVKLVQDMGLKMMRIVLVKKTFLSP